MLQEILKAFINTLKKEKAKKQSKKAIDMVIISIKKIV